MRTSTFGPLGLLLHLTLAATLASGADSGATLNAGIEQVRKGDFAVAALTLDDVIRQLSNQPLRVSDLVRAYLHSGVAYAGLGERELALAKFRRAFEIHARARIAGVPPFPKIPSDPTSVSARAIYDEALATHKSREKIARRARSKWWLLPTTLVAVGGATGMGLASSAEGKERSNQPPADVKIDQSPAGILIYEVTRFTVSATASDPDGEPLRCEWQLPGGHTARGCTQASIFPDAQGTNEMRVTVYDGLGASASATKTVTQEKLTSTYQATTATLFGLSRLTLTHNRSSLKVDAGFASGTSITTYGWVTDPRRLRVSFRVSECPLTLSGELSSDLNTVSGTLTCLAWPQCGAYGGQSIAVTFKR
jgi:hypothetical protein